MNLQAVDIASLQVHAGHRCILDISQLQVMQGIVAAVLGPNGAGKTTLLRACLGLISTRGGTVKILGEDIGALKGKSLADLRCRIGYVPQLLPGRTELPLTVREVVSIGRAGRAGLFHSLSQSDWRIVDSWIGRLGLSDLSDSVFNKISGGEQRKTVIARAMAQEPDLLLLDEPVANLDLGWRERIVETIQQLHSQTQITILLICHELEVLPPCCHQVVLLDQGRILASGNPEKTITPDRVAQLYGPGLNVHRCAGRYAIIPQGGSHV